MERMIYTVSIVAASVAIASAGILLWLYLEAKDAAERKYREEMKTR